MLPESAEHATTSNDLCSVKLNLAVSPNHVIVLTAENWPNQCHPYNQGQAIRGKTGIGKWEENKNGKL